MCSPLEKEKLYEEMFFILKRFIVFQIKYSGPPIVKVGCGAEFSLILDCKGVLYSFGSPEYGQLGANFDFYIFINCAIYRIRKIKYNL